jgi:hypothetical protein
MSNVCQIIAWNLLPETDVQSLCRELSRQIDIIHPLWRCSHASSQMLSFMGTTWLSFLAACEWTTTRQVPPVMRCYKLVWNLILHYLTLLRTTINQAVNPVLNQLRVFVCFLPTSPFLRNWRDLGPALSQPQGNYKKALGAYHKAHKGLPCSDLPRARWCWSRWRPESDMDMVAESKKDTLQ